MSFRRTSTVATTLKPIIAMHLLRDAPVAFQFWDGSRLGPHDAQTTVEIRSVDALRHIVWAPSELGVARAFLTGKIEMRGGDLQALRLLRGASSGAMSRHPKALASYVRAAVALNLLGRRPLVPDGEFKPRWFRHSKQRDRAVIGYHYDVSNAAFEKILGPSMAYTCARFTDENWTLEQAQHAKHDGICLKLGLKPGMRMLDVGCGWGALAIHAARNYGVTVMGVTISEAQANYARKWIADEGLADSIEIVLQDYRDVDEGKPYDAIASIGMLENVGSRHLNTYCEKMARLLGPNGRFLNQAIAATGKSKIGRFTFAQRYVFPDGELLDVANVAQALQGAGLEIESIESLRRYYGPTLTFWVRNLAENYEAVEAEIGSIRARVFRLFMTASINKFETGRLNVFQTVSSPGHQDRFRS